MLNKVFRFVPKTSFPIKVNKNKKWKKLKVKKSSYLIDFQHFKELSNHM